MADNQLVITAGLDIPKTVSTIKKDLKQVSDQLDKDYALKIVGNIDLGKTTQRIQSQITTISKNLSLSIPKIDLQTSGDETVQKFLHHTDRRCIHSASAVCFGFHRYRAGSFRYGRHYF